MRLALAYRQTFGQDVVVDFVCYRRHGQRDRRAQLHAANDAQNLKTKRINELYTETLLSRKDLDQNEVDGVKTIMANQLQDALDTIKGQPAEDSRAAFEGYWHGLTHSFNHDPVETGVQLERIDEIGKALSTWPQDFAVHHKIKKMATERGRLVAERQKIDWALAELLASAVYCRTVFPCAYPAKTVVVVRLANATVIGTILIPANVIVR